MCERKIYTPEEIRCVETKRKILEHLKNARELISQDPTIAGQFHRRSLKELRKMARDVQKSITDLIGKDQEGHK